MYRVLVAEPAELDIASAYEWWRSEKSAEQAERWYAQIGHAIETLRASPERCPVSPESELLATGLRQLAFGIGRRPTHRMSSRWLDLMLWFCESATPPKMRWPKATWVSLLFLGARGRIANSRVDRRMALGRVVV